jgi:hypothetical protein
VLDNLDISIITNEKEIKEIFSKSSRLKDTDINKYISKPLSNFTEHFTKINHYDTHIPVFINNEDITLFFIDYLYGFKVDIWNTFFIGNSGIPERYIETLICRVSLSTQLFLSNRECIRYSLLYSIFKFHYNNISFIDQYLTVLKNSIMSKNDFKSNIIRYDYIETLYKTATNITEKHYKIYKDNSTKINYNDIYEDIVMLYQIVCMFEKLIYSIISDIKLSDYELVESLRDFDTIVYNKHKYKYISPIPINEKSTKVCTSFFIEKLKKITKQVLESIKEDKPCTATFEFQ